MSYYSLSGAVTVDLSLSTAQNTGSGGTDTLLTMQHLDGSNAGADRLTGNGGDNRINGYSGADTLNGGTGNDSLAGGEDDDRFLADAGDDRIDGGNGTDTASYYAITSDIILNLTIITAQSLGSAGHDTLLQIENIEGSNTGNDRLSGDEENNLLSGFGGNDVLKGGAGADTLDGGSGIDTADYSGVAGAVTAELWRGVFTKDGEGSADTAISIENVTGGAFNDLLAGDAAANLLNGGAGADRMSGGNGADTLIGGAGADTLAGEAGNDVFDLNSLSESGLSSSSWDQLIDFVSGQDKIDLTTLDANAASTSTNEAFVFIGSAAFSSSNATGQLRYSYDAGSGTSMVYGSTDSDNAAEFAIQLMGVSSLVVSDFLL